MAEEEESNLELVLELGELARWPAAAGAPEQRRVHRLQHLVRHAHLDSGTAGYCGAVFRRLYGGCVAAAKDAIATPTSTRRSSFARACESVKYLIIWSLIQLAIQPSA